MNFKNIILFILSLVIFSGCSTISPTISDYRIDTKTEKQNFSQQGCKHSSLKVAQAFSANSLMTLDMNYGQGEYKQFTFSQSKWAKSPNKAITSEIIRYIKSTTLFKNVQMAKSRTRNELLLEINIDDFMQYFSKDEKSSYVNISITLTLVDMKTSKVIDTHSFEIKHDVAMINAHGGVIALNGALKEMLQESGVWLSGVCK
jgi:cholesterol transport system auxiliary component